MPKNVGEPPAKELDVFITVGFNQRKNNDCNIGGASVAKNY